MKATIDLDDDVATAIGRLRQQSGLELSEAVNHVLRMGLLYKEQTSPFQSPTRSLGLRVDVTNAADALDLLEGDNRS